MDFSKMFLLSVLASSVLLLGCLGSSGTVGATAAPSVDPRELPLEQATKRMMEEMRTTGGDTSVAKEPLAGDAAFSGEAKRSGAFQKLGYTTEGTARVESRDGKFFVVFGENFSTPNGPDLVVYLTKNSGPTTREDLKQGVELGELKSLKGKQVYEFPAGVDALQYNSVSIHCRSFNVPWSYAPLE